jgi:hypothetical protein
MWGKMVVGKIDEYVEVFTLVVTLRNIEDHSIWAFAGVYGPNWLILIRIEGFFGMSWLVCSVGGTCLGVLGVI